MESPRVVIIGAGIIGSAIALEMSRRGWETVVVDRGGAPGHGSTAASSAVVRFTYSTVDGTALAYEGVEYWRGWPGHIGMQDRPLANFVQCGMVMFDDATGLAKASLPPLDAVGVTYEWWSSEELKKRLPEVSIRAWYPPTTPDDPAFFAEGVDELAGALFTPEAGYVPDPQLAAQNLADAASAAGATFRFHSEVISVHTEMACRIGGGCTRVTGVELRSGEVISGDIVINASGPHSAIVNEMAGALTDMTVRTRPLRQQVGHVRAPAALGPAIARYPACGDFDSGMYIRPDGEALLVGGVEAECDPMVWLDNPDEVDMTLDLGEWETQAMRVARRIPEFGIPHERRGVVGVYDVSDDWIPIIDRSAVDGFYMAVGSSGNQFKNAPVIGHCIAELIEAVEAGHDHDRDPVVVVGVYRGLRINMGTFSRRRVVGQSNRGVLG